MTRRSEAPPICWPFITFLSKMTDNEGKKESPKDNVCVCVGVVMCVCVWGGLMGEEG